MAPAWKASVFALWVAVVLASGTEEAAPPPAVAAAASEATAVVPALRGAEPVLGTQAETGGEAQGPCQRAKALAPLCVAKCPQMCVPLGEATQAFFGKGKQQGAMKVVCKNKEAFECGYKHKKQCEPIAKKAKRLGFDIPTSTQEANDACRRAGFR